MSKEIIAALLGAGATIVAATVPLAWTAATDRRAKHLSARREALMGRWEGVGRDNYIENPAHPLFTFESVMTFSAVGRIVRAQAIVKEAGAHNFDELTLSGAFYSDDYLQLTYCNSNLAKKQLGVVVLGLSSDGSRLKGYYTGFSPRRDSIIAGIISLGKKN